ncbi:hypothetical protein Bca52824_011314 [Brassica carinata]|uniref:Uncharacterized protein n=1 Tax=Brassica carinata TaxID=52824 RepID=A0A8X7WFL2_BRACI|nr:hypothetical protein Bca52824_011314 [Brassica carinata]
MRTGDRILNLIANRMGRAVYEVDNFVEDLKQAIIESYGLVGMSVVAEMSYWLGEHGSCAIGGQIHQRFVTFKEEIDGKMNFLRPMGNLLKSKEVASSSNMQVGSTSTDVHTRNEVNDGETDLTEDEIILMRVAEIEAVYAANGFGMREVDGTACEVQNKVDRTEDSTLEEAEDDDDEDYDFNLWHDFLGRNCEWDDDKDEDGGISGGARTNVTYGGVRGEVATKARIGRTNPSSNKGSGSSTNKQRTANPPSTFEDYVDEGRFYIGSSRYSMENTEEESTNSGVKSSDQVPETKNHSDQEEDPSVDSSSQILVLVTPPKPFNMHTREVDDSDDFVGQYNKMTDPYYKEMKHQKREYDWVSNCIYANYKIPTKCICGGAITVETDEKGRNYYVCKDFKNDGLHIRHDCLAALEEELDCLRSQYAEEVSLRRELQFELAQMRWSISPFLLKADAGNINAIYYEGIHAASRIGLHESIQIMEPNVPIHGLSTLAVGIFNVCLGNGRKPAKCFSSHVSP